MKRFWPETTPDTKRFCNYCYETLRRFLPRYHSQIDGYRANDIAHEVTTQCFLQSKEQPGFLERFDKTGLDHYLLKQCRYLRLTRAREVALAKERFTHSVEEAEEQGLLGYASLDGSPCDGHDNSSHILLARRLEPVVSKAVPKLTEKRRLAIEMITEGARHAEIASQLKMNVKAVGQELKRARAAIRKALPAKYLEMLDALLE